MRTSVAAMLILALTLASGASAQESPALPAPAEARLDLHGFFDVTATAARTTAPSGDSTSLGFSLGQFDLFLTSRISDRVSFLGEVVVEGEANGETGIDLERAYVRYTFSDRFRCTVGRTHSAVSAWYVTHHHGALLQPTIERPAPVRFEDEPDGGLLPAHAVGIEFSGREAIGERWFEWAANVSNGRPADRSGVQVGGDANRDKQIGASGSLVGRGTVEWRIGGALYRDRLPPMTDGGPDADETIASAHLLTRGGWWEQEGEYFAIRGRDRASGERGTTHAWYGVVTLGTSVWRPYLGFEGMRPEVVSGVAPPRGDLDRVTVGWRFDVSALALVRAEYRNVLREGARTHEWLMQTAFSF